MALFSIVDVDVVVDGDGDVNEFSGKSASHVAVKVHDNDNVYDNDNRHFRTGTS